MNERTLKVLEYDKIISKIEGYAGSMRGKALVRELQPLTSPTLIKEALRITSEAVTLLSLAERVPLGGIFDITAAVKRAAINATLSPTELLEVGSTVRAARLMKEFITSHPDNLEYLLDWGQRLGSYPWLEREIERCLGPEGEVLDSASPKLHSLRSQMKVIQNRVRDKLDSIIHSSENAKYLQDLLITVRNDRYVIPVKQEYRSLFPGIVHDQSSSGATLFIEPMAVVELNNQLRLIETQEVEEVNRILADLTHRVKEISADLTITLEILARLDLAFAKARYSIEIRGIEPELGTDGVVELLEARHPLLTGKVVPITVTLGKTFDTLVITGPNTGGKTVTLKTVGLLTLMAQSGIHIPALLGSRINIFEAIYCDLGDEQSIEQSLSTFSAHMTQIVKIIDAVTGPECLVLLDELGAGTDPTEGAALAMSILSHLHHLGVRTVATTHYSELKAFAYKTDGIENASVEFDIETLRPTYHLIIGLPGSSQAFEIASKLGLPDFLITNARGYISAEAAQVEEMLKQIENDRRKAREDRLLSEEARAKSELYKQRYESEISKFNAEKEELLRQAKAEAREILLEARRESENLMRRLKEASQEELNSIINEARQEITEQIKQLEEKPNQSESQRKVNMEQFKNGSRVRAISLNQFGTIVELGNDTALVQLGIMKVTLPLTDLELIVDNQVKKVERLLRKVGTTGMEAAQNIATEISLRGMTVDEALYELDKYLDQAMLAGLKKFRVIHGKGTGALRQAVQKHLREHPMVKSVAFAEQNEGGLGATVVELR
ncbi:MAG TPA: endonuclease MutS2 [Bacillota bacterium]|nr:endonuclease MutS2 [Bacillota bacterium]HOL08583.1 endonuclease MutS2 [Bacillota bacterium]HPO97803.1 endonuclease MutS2 [Bacillota bacterium]